MPDKQQAAYKKTVLRTAVDRPRESTASELPDITPADYRRDPDLGHRDDGPATTGKGTVAEPNSNNNGDGGGGQYATAASGWS